MAMSQSIIEKGSDEIDEHGTLKSNTAVKNKVFDFCTFCIPQGKHQPATHFCFECGPFGRYICGTCEKNHEMFVSDHTIKRITEAKGEPRYNDMKRKWEKACELNEDYKEHCEKLYKEKHMLEKKEKSLNREIESLNAAIEDEKRKNSENIKKLLQERDDLRDRLGNANHNENDLRAKLRKETEMKDKYKEDIQVLAEQKNYVHKRLNVQMEDINELQREKANFENDIKKLCKENECLQKELAFQRQKYDVDMKANNKHIEQLKIEKDFYRDRFSTDVDADITDLSGPNRAMKLAEKYSGLYDDEWTDAFLTLCDNKMPKKDALQFLVRILKSCYDSCEFIATQQIATLTENLMFPVQTVGKVTKEQASIKAKTRLSSKNEGILGDARRKMWEASIDVIKQALFEQTKEWMNKEIGQQAFEDIKPYTEKCVEICWLMVIHEPPIYMKTETTPDENIDPSIYVPYSASGKKIDFIVWPPLYNGKGGDLLSKGVVELIKTVKK